MGLGHGHHEGKYLWAASREASTREKQPARRPTALMRMAAAQVAPRTARRPVAAGAVASRSGLGRMPDHLRDPPRMSLMITISSEAALGQKPTSRRQKRVVFRRAAVSNPQQFLQFW